MIAFQASISKGWLHQRGHFEFGERYYMDPLYRMNQDREMDVFIRNEFGDYPVFNMEANLMQAGYIHKNQVLVGGIQPNLILSKIAGANFVYYTDKDMDVSGNPLATISDADELPEPSGLLSHPFIKMLDDQIAELDTEYPELEVIPPFFWDSSGRATIHGIITTSFKMIGDRAMTMIIIEPELLHSIHQWITSVNMVLIDHFAGMANHPVRSVHVGECSGAMISNEQYLEFITPYISTLGRRYGDVRLHSCGFSDHILESISKIENLKVMDVGSNTSVAKIREIKGPDFEINVEPPLKLMMKKTDSQDLMQWLDIILEENQGGPLKIAMHLEADYSIEYCLKIYDELLKRDLILKAGMIKKRKGGKKPIINDE